MGSSSPGLAQASKPPSWAEIIGLAWSQAKLSQASWAGSSRFISLDKPSKPISPIGQAEIKESNKISLYYMSFANLLFFSPTKNFFDNSDMSFSLAIVFVYKCYNIIFINQI